MSDIEPFKVGDVSLPASQPVSSDVEVFRPDLRDFDWPSYEARQARINTLLENGGAGLDSLLRELVDHNPEVGVTLNNLHNTTIEGKVPRGLTASLSVMSRSVIKTSFQGIDFKGGVAPEATFSGQNLIGGNFTNSILTRSVFKRTNLRGADFTNAVINGVNFQGANLEGADFTGAYLVDVLGLTEQQIRSMKLQASRTVVQSPAGPTSLEQLLASRFGEAQNFDDILKFLDPVPVAINQETGPPIGRLQAKRLLRGLYAQNMNWTQVDFTSSDLTGATIDGLVANQGSLRAATIGGTLIKRAMMREMDMVSTWAPGVVLEDVDLRGANLTRANLVGSVLRGVDLRGVTGLNDKGTNIEGLVIAEDCILPVGYGYDGVTLQTTEKLKRELEQ